MMNIKSKAYRQSADATNAASRRDIGGRMRCQLIKIAGLAGLSLIALVADTRFQAEPPGNSNMNQLLLSGSVARPKNDLEKVVLQYCQYAYRGEIVKSKRFVSVKITRSNGHDTSREDAPSLDLGRYVVKRVLEKDIPEMIWTGKLYVSEIATVNQKRVTGSVRVVLRSGVDSTKDVSITFDLARSNKTGWKLMKAYYDDGLSLDTSTGLPLFNNQTNALTNSAAG